MEALSCRLLPYASADGPTNMAADEALVHSAAAGVASLRFYGWLRATLSLGYFQPAAARLADPSLAALPWVRRPSGGATLVHHHEVTYALALPPAKEWHGAKAWMPRMHGIIAKALASLGVKLNPVTGETLRHGEVLCFQQHTAGDLLCTGCKVVGSAQRKYHLCLLQHGSILLEQSEHAPALPGIRELSGSALTIPDVCSAVTDAFILDTRWKLEPADWNVEERAETKRLIVEKYTAASWNKKR